MSGSGAKPILARDGHSYTAPKLTVGDWSMSHSSMTIALAAGPYDPRSGPKRGQLCVVKMGLKGWGADDFVPVYYGACQDVVRQGASRWSLELRGLLSTLVQRAAASDNTKLFPDLPIEVTLTGNRLPGGAVELTDTSDFEADSAGSALYCVEITPTGGDPFVASSASKTALQLDAPLVDRIGTTDSGGDTGDTARVMAAIQGHPVTIARKLLQSSIAGDNGALDTLPSGWGMAVPLDLIDTLDCEDTETLVLPAEEVFVAAAEAIDDPLSWMQGWLGQMGMFLTERAGLITVRAVPSSVSGIVDTYVVQDHELVELVDYNTYNPDQMVEYQRMTLVHLDPVTISLSDEDVLTRPQKYASVDRVEYVDTNPSTWLPDIISRVGPWMTRISEAITIRVSGLKLAFAAPGSHLYIYSRFTDDRYGVIGVPWLITSVQPDWFGRYVTVTAAFVPITDTE